MKRGIPTKIPGIYQRADQGFVVVVSKRTDRGKLVRERICGGPLSVAVELREKMFRELEVGASRFSEAGEGETLREAVERIVEGKLARCRIRPHVALRMKIQSKMFGNLLEGKVQEITRRDIDNWVMGLPQKCRPDGGEYRWSTYSSVWSVMRMIFRRLVAEGVIDRNPTEGVEFLRGSPAKRISLTEVELNRLLENTGGESEDIAAMIWVLGTTGMRFGECSALKWSDIDLVGRTININKSQVGGFVGLTKSRADRIVPLQARVADMLKGLNSTSEKWSELCFPSRRGGYRFSSVLIKPLERVRQGAGIEKRVTPHVLRRAVNDVLRRRAGQTVAMAILGHVTQEMHRHYSTVEVGEAAEALSVVGNPVGQGRES